MIIELGGGTKPNPKADVIIDLHHPKGCPAQDASAANWTRTIQGHGFESGIADEVYCSHFLEHIPQGQPRLNVFNEAWRVLKPGGRFVMIMPLIGYTSPHDGCPRKDHIGWQPWADPTHVSQWWFPESLLYFCEGPFKPNADYGTKTWAPLGPYLDTKGVYDAADLEGSYWGVNDGWEGVAVLVKPS